MQQIQRTISPIDGSIYVERELASPQQIESRLAGAEAAQRKWRLVPVSERAAVCRRMLAWLLERAEEIGEELTWQMGRPIAYSPNEIRRGFQDRVNYMAGIAERELADIQIEPMENFRRFIRREPVGVVLVLAPWNYPWLASVPKRFRAFLMTPRMYLIIFGNTIIEISKPIATTINNRIG